MFVSPIPPRGPAAARRRGRLRLPPAFLGAAAVLLSAVVALAQTRPAAGPVATPTTAPAAAASEPAPAAAAPKDDLSLWELHQKGGYVMYVLDACSVLAVAIILERLFSLRRAKVLPAMFLPGLRSVYRDPYQDRERAIQYAEADGSAMGRMVAAYLKRLPRGHAAAEKAMEDVGANESLRLRANFRIFYAIGSVATLLGLIGTIAGMIKAFRVTAQAGDAANKVELLSTGIYEAMVCTFGGLAVAIIVTVFYYYFVGRVEKLVTEMNDEVARFADEFTAAAPDPAAAAVIPVARTAPPPPPMGTSAALA